MRRVDEVGFRTVYSTALWPGMVRGLPSGPKRPMRGPATQAPARPATPPTMCTAPEPTVSYTPAPQGFFKKP